MAAWLLNLDMGGTIVGPSVPVAGPYAVEAISAFVAGGVELAAWTPGAEQSAAFFAGQQEGAVS